MLAVYIEKDRFETKISTSVIIVGRNICGWFVKYSKFLPI